MLFIYAKKNLLKTYDFKQEIDKDFQVSLYQTESKPKW